MFKGYCFYLSNVKDVKRRCIQLFGNAEKKLLDKLGKINVDWQKYLSRQPIVPNIETNPILPGNSNLASEFYKRLVEMVNDFDASLDQEHEVGVRLVSHGQIIQFHVEDIGYWDPSLICFYGILEDSSRVKLIQHVSQLSFLLMAVKRSNPEEPKRSIGFSSIELN